MDIGRTEKLTSLDWEDVEVGNKLPDKLRNKFALRIFLFLYLSPAENRLSRSKLVGSLELLEEDSRREFGPEFFGFKLSLLKLMCVYSEKRNRSFSLFDFSTEVLKIPEDLFSPIITPQSENIDRIAALAYSLALARPTVQVSCYPNSSVNNVDSEKTRNVPAGWAKFCTETARLGGWLNSLKEKDERKYLKAQQMRLEEELEKLVERKNEHLASPNYMEAEISGYKNTCSEFLEYACECARNGEDLPVRSNSFWAKVAGRVDGMERLERCFPFLEDMVKQMFGIALYTQLHEFREELAEAVRHKQEDESAEIIFVRSASSEAPEELREEERNVVELLEVMERNLRVQEVLKENPKQNMGRTESITACSRVEKVESDRREAVKLFGLLTRKEKEDWKEMARRWKDFLQGKLVKKSSLLCQAHFIHNTCSSVCAFSHSILPQHISASIPLEQRLSIAGKANEKKLADPQLRLCSFQQCMHSPNTCFRVENLSEADRQWLSSKEKFCWRSVFSECRDRDCELLHQVKCHHLRCTTKNVELRPKVCRTYFLDKNACPYDNCRKGHHLIALADFHPDEQKSFLRWQELCWNFLMYGNCSHGKECVHKHLITPENLYRRGVDLLEVYDVLEKKNLCIKYFKDHRSCNSGRPSCRLDYSHVVSIDDLRTKDKQSFFDWQKLCYDHFFNGNCHSKLCKKTHVVRDTNLRRKGFRVHDKQWCLLHFAKRHCKGDCGYSHQLTQDDLSQNEFDLFQQWMDDQLCWFSVCFSCKKTSCRLEHELLQKHLCCRIKDQCCFNCLLGNCNRSHNRTSTYRLSDLAQKEKISFLDFAERKKRHEDSRNEQKRSNKN